MFDDFVRGYIECALWSSTDDSDESGGIPLDRNYTQADIDPATMERMRIDCEDFYQNNTIPSYNLESWSDDEMAGHDFWLTRNHHGVGFWNRDFLGSAAKELTDASQAYGEYSLYVGDDGKLYGI